MTKHCPRCGEEVKGHGKTGMCNACATSLFNKSRGGRDAGNGWRTMRRTQERQRFWRAVENRRPEGYSEPSLPKFKFMEDVE